MATRSGYNKRKAARIRAHVFAKRREAGQLPSKTEVKTNLEYLAALKLKTKRESGNGDDGTSSGK